MSQFASSYVNARYNLGGIIFTIPTPAINPELVPNQEEDVNSWFDGRPIAPAEEIENGHAHSEDINSWFDGRAVEQLHEKEL